MQSTHRFLIAFGIVAGLLLAVSDKTTSPLVDKAIGYRFPEAVGAVPADLKASDAPIAESINLVRSAGVDVGPAVRGVIAVSQGETLNYFDPTARDERGNPLWSDPKQIPADSMSMLRSTLQAAMVADYAAGLPETERQALGLSRFGAVTISAIERMRADRFVGATAADRKLADAFLALPGGIAERVFAVSEAALAAGTLRTLPGAASGDVNEGIRALGLAILLAMAFAYGSMILESELRNRQRAARSALRAARLA